eukprot:355089-Chlamydomonas_euryale.AAC.3
MRVRVRVRASGRACVRALQDVHVRVVLCATTQAVQQVSKVIASEEIGASTPIALVHAAAEANRMLSRCIGRGSSLGRIRLAKGAGSQPCWRNAACLRTWKSICMRRRGLREGLSARRLRQYQHKK